MKKGEELDKIVYVETSKQNAPRSFCAFLSDKLKRRHILKRGIKLILFFPGPLISNGREKMT